MQPESNIALKEWASAVHALEQGRQILIMRKGGIREETHEFRLETDRFFFFPTYEHQKKELLKPEFHPFIDRSLENWRPEDRFIPITSFAEVAQDILIHDERQLDLIADFHIWTDRFAEDRLRWKKAQPLHVLLLRVYRLNEPAWVPQKPEYTGCKSWIELTDDIPDLTAEPAVDDEPFAKRVEMLRSLLKV